MAPERVQSFEEVERQVAFDLSLQRREDTVRRYLDATAARYEIAVDRCAAGHRVRVGGRDHDVPEVPARPPGGTAAFHIGSPSLYYARVPQLPTSRWSVFDCQRSPGAWTSPIWYLP